MTRTRYIYDQDNSILRPDGETVEDACLELNQLYFQKESFKSTIQQFLDSPPSLMSTKLGMLTVNPDGMRVLSDAYSRLQSKLMNITILLEAYRNSKRHTPEAIFELTEGQIFVFGSNTAGRHGAGAARIAAKNFKAQYGVGSGPTGFTYAIPTKDSALNTLPLSVIAEHASSFFWYAKQNPSLDFLVTPIGCGLAGYTASDIAPIFERCVELQNVRLPSTFFDTLLSKLLSTD